MAKLHANAAPNPVARLRNPLVYVGLVVTLGTLGYMLIERWNLLDSFYMTVTTISTVGFQEVHPLDTVGRLFTVLLIVTGVGGLFYTAAILAETIIEGHLREYARSRRMQRDLGRLEQHVIVCSYGRTGRQVASELAQTGTDFVVIENNDEVLPRLREAGYPYIEGDAASDEVLLLAGIERARGLVSAVDSDQTNVYTVLTARSLNPALFIIARAGYSASVSKLERAGANRVISPYRMAGHRMAHMVLQPAVVDVLDEITNESGDGLAVDEMMLGQRSKSIGMTLDSSGLTRQGAIILALRRASGELEVNPSGDARLQLGDLLVAIGTRTQLSAIEALL
ncbi:MAG: potassium channel family protein [Candidatus Dormibacteria bacterium]